MSMGRTLKGAKYITPLDRDVIVLDDPQPDEGDQLLGFDVNAFESTQVYAIFNDSESFDVVNLPEAIKAQVVDVPLYEDDSLQRVVNHARLMNEDRDRLTPPRGHVKVRVMTILKTPWTDVEI